MKISGKAIEGLEKENFRGPACKRKNRQPDVPAVGNSLSIGGKL